MQSGYFASILIRFSSFYVGGAMKSADRTGLSS
jgi:hypothetical protein